MAFARLVQFLAFAIAGVHASNTTDSLTSAGVLRRLEGSSPGNVAACYTPFHNAQYPLFGGAADTNALRNAIENDFSIMSKHFTHVRTYYSMHYGIEIAPIAAKYGIKLFLGVFLTSESWGADETNAAVNAIKKYSDTVEVISVGNENLKDFGQRSWDILNKINEIKSLAGADAWRVKYGTVQRANEFIESKYDWDMQQLNANLDILGVNIYPFFDNGYDGNNPTRLLDAQWNLVVNKYPRDKIRLTETGFPTAGAPSWISPNVWPSLDSSFKYYEAVVNWSPKGYEDKPKYWFQAFDRRAGDPSAGGIELELYFGFYTIQKTIKRDGYPRLKGSQPSTSTCSIEEGVDYAGNDVASRAAARAEDCFALCNGVSGCGAFTWTTYNSGTCWLKSAKGATSANSGARSAVACQCDLGGLEVGVDYAGNDIASAYGVNAEACISICKGQSGCRAFTWSTYNGGTCWLKSAKGATSTNTGATSGVIC